MHSKAEHERYLRLVQRAMAQVLADPMVRIQLAGLHGQEREDRASAIVIPRLKADPKVRPLLDAIGRQLVDAEIDRMAEEELEQLVAAGKARREIDPATGEFIYLSVEGNTR
jgi:hypothetical protein